MQGANRVEHASPMEEASRERFLADTKRREKKARAKAREERSAGVRLRSTDKGPGNPQQVPLAVSVRSSAPGVMESAAAQITQCSQPLASL